MLVVRRQLREAQAKLQDESFVAATPTFQVVQRQAAAAGTELEKARRLLEGMQRESDACKHSMQGLVQQVRPAECVEGVPEISRSDNNPVAVHNDVDV